LEFFEQGEKINKDHYIAVYLTYNKTFWPKKIAVMKKHIISDCLKMDNSICDTIIYMVETYQTPPNFIGIKCKNSQIESDQTTLNNFYKNSDLMKE